MAPVWTNSSPPALPVRPEGGHKGTFGTVIVVGGCGTMIGAPALCATAAIRGGAGLVKIASAARLLPHMLTIEPSATGIAMSEQEPVNSVIALDEADPDHEAVLAVGPGMGKESGAGALVQTLLAGRRAMVLDADGLNLLAQTGRSRGGGVKSLVLTPHPGEFRRLAAPLGITEDPTDPASRAEAARKLARAHRAVVVLKGHKTVVSDDGEPGRCYVNRTGNPALATAGSGDVLTGLIAALMAQGMLPFEAAQLGVYLHGLAGDLWARQHGPSGLTAGDLARLIPSAAQQHRGQA